MSYLHVVLIQLCQVIVMDFWTYRWMLSTLWTGETELQVSVKSLSYRENIETMLKTQIYCKDVCSKSEEVQMKPTMAKIL